VNLSRYKNLLTAIASELSNIGDTKGARFFVRWLRIVDELRDASHPESKTQESSRRGTKKCKGYCHPGN